MSTTTAGILFTSSLVLALILVHKPLGDYMYRVYSGTKHSRVERGIYSSAPTPTGSRRGRSTPAACWPSPR